MSQKVGLGGNVVGPYCEDDLACLIDSPVKTKSRKRKSRPQQDKQRVLHYNLIWDITEMQVKIHVQALFPNQNGPLFSQLAKERALDTDEKMVAKESRSTALEKDIQLTHPELLEEELQEANRVEGGSDEEILPADGVLGGVEFQETDNAAVLEHPTPRAEESSRLAVEPTRELPVVHNDILATQHPVFPTFQSQPTTTTNHHHQLYDHSVEMGAVSEFKQQPDGIQISNNQNNVGIFDNTTLYQSMELTKDRKYGEIAPK